jgi:hypothetical protein
MVEILYASIAGFAVPGFITDKASAMIAEEKFGSTASPKLLKSK